MMTLQHAAALMGIDGQMVDTRFSHVETDTRQSVAGALFFALHGEHFNGHDFVTSAAERGAVAAVVDADWLASAPQCDDFPLLVVDDTRHALAALGQQWRQKISPRLIGVTGSNGKTTVKEMCAAILQQMMRRLHGDEGENAVLATAGNYNNDIGVPLTLLRLRPSHRMAVVEMGMNHPGEIIRLADIARPDVAVVTNAQRAHLSGLGRLSDIAEEKGMLYRALGSEGVAVINVDDPYAGLWHDMAQQCAVLTFGATREANLQGRYRVKGLQTWLQINGEAEIVLSVPGKHNAENALTAAAASMAAGAEMVDVIAGLTSFNGVAGRLQQLRGVNNSLILNDSYNANPDSVCAAIDVLAEIPGRRILVLGDMGEAGVGAAQLHDEIGGYAKSKGIDALLATGKLSAVAAKAFGSGGQWFADISRLSGNVLKQMTEDTVVLIKGSRFMQMERVVQRLQGHDDASISAFEGVSDAA